MLVGGIDFGSHQIEVKTLVLPLIRYINMGISSKVLPSPMNASLCEEDLIAFQKDTPLGQLIDPMQVAEAVCYLADAKMVTGQILSVDGGIVI